MSDTHLSERARWVVCCHYLATTLFPGVRPDPDIFEALLRDLGVTQECLEKFVNDEAETLPG